MKCNLCNKNGIITKKTLLNKNTLEKEIHNICMDCFVKIKEFREENYTMWNSKDFTDNVINHEIGNIFGRTWEQINNMQHKKY